VLDIGAGEAAQDRFGLGGAEPERGGALHHLVVPPRDRGPVDRPRQRVPEARPGVGAARLGPVEALLLDALDAGQELKAEQPARGANATSLRPRLSTDCRSTAISVQ
jgi:hypothetical protein